MMSRSKCVFFHVSVRRAERKDLLFYLILHIQRALLVMEESQGHHVAVSRRVVDGVGSALRVGERTALQDLSLTFSKESAATR